MTDKLRYYNNQKEIFTKLHRTAESRYLKHYEFRETAENFSDWCDENNALRSKMDYYEMILNEIEDILIALNDIIESEKNIKTFKKRLDKSKIM